MRVGQRVQDNEGWDEVKSLIRTLAASSHWQPGSFDALQGMVDELKMLTSCDHIFLSLYNSESKVFKAAAWHSPFKPVDIPREQKFMWDRYYAQESVLINDLSIYNYRLTPRAARTQQMRSMAGVPIKGAESIVGVLEVYAKEQNAFNETDVGILQIYAGRAASLLAKLEQDQELAYLKAENSLLRLLIRSEKLPFLELLVNVSNLFKETLPMDGMVALAVEDCRETPSLIAAASEKISQAGIEKLKLAFTGEFLQKLANLPDESRERFLLVHTGSATGGEARAAYIVPIAWRQQIHGLIVFFSKDLERTSQSRLLRFIQQITEHIGYVFERKQTFVHMQKISLTDSLTGLANRRLFDYVLSREIKRVKRTGKPLSLMLIDIDFFKAVNDTYGHAVGDRVLVEMGALLTASLRETDVCARYGGEEFAVILPETGRSEAMVIAERMRADAANRGFGNEGQKLSITVSIGIATYEQSAEDLTPLELVQGADQALYRAKELGRNLTIVWPGKQQNGHAQA